MPTRLKRLACSSFVLVLACAHSDSVFAATGGSLPWDTPGTTIVNWVTGPLVRWGSAIVIVLCGLAFAADEERLPKWIGKFLRVIVGIAIAGAALSWGLPFLGITGGALLP